MVLLSVPKKALAGCSPLISSTRCATVASARMCLDLFLESGVLLFELCTHRRASAIRRVVMSETAPTIRTTRPASSRTPIARSCIQRQEPSGNASRYSCSNSSVSDLRYAHSASRYPLKSGWTRSFSEPRSVLRRIRANHTLVHGHVERLRAEVPFVDAVRCCACGQGVSLFA